MKKIKVGISILIMGVLALCFAACGGNSYFDGNYSAKASASEIQELKTDLASSAETSPLDGYGYRMIIDTSMLKMDIKTTGTTASNVEMSGSLTVTSGSIKTTIKMYYGDGWMYSNMTSSDYSVKVKSQIPMMDFLDDYTTDVLDEDVMDITGLLSEYTSENMSVYIDESNADSKKIKIVYTEGSNSAEMYFVYNSSKALTAFKSVTKYEGETIKLEVSPYSGSVDVPTDLNTYTTTPI